MNASSHHLQFSRLADLAEERVSADERQNLLNHVAGCSACSARLTELQQTICLMKSDLSEDAPRDIRAFAVNLFANRRAKPTALRRILAILTFDSRTSTPAFGLRSGLSASRQLIYSAEGRDIDVHLNSENDLWSISGQVLGADCSTGQVEISGDQESQLSRLNDSCEFTLQPLAPGSYKLRLQLDDVEIEMPNLELN